MRLAAIGQISGSIAHELRNPLGSVRNAVYYLQHGLANQAKATEFLEIIDQQTSRADQIITNLLEMTRSKEVLTTLVDLQELVSETLAQLPDTGVIPCTFSIDPDPFLFHADREQFRQVVTNLINNAVQATGGKGELVITASRHETGSVLVFRDTGPGIPTAIRGTLFEPLVSTKTTGTGLGLAICRQIIERHGGTIEAVYDESLGASLRISLPHGQHRTTGW